MKKLILIVLAAMTTMTMTAKPFAYEQVDGKPILSFRSTQYNMQYTSQRTFSVAPMHSPMTGSYVLRLRTDLKDYLPVTDGLMSSGSEYSSVIAYSSPRLAPSRPLREGAYDPDDPFGGETIDDVNNPQQPGTPLPDGTWLLLLMASAYMLYIARKRRLKVEEGDMLK